MNAMCIDWNLCLAGKKMKMTIEKLEEELRQWRSGQTVDQSEQIQLGAGVMEESMTSAPSLQQLNKPTADFDLTRSHISQVRDNIYHLTFLVVSSGCQKHT